MDIEEVLAKQAITEQVYRYCRGTDRMDYDLTRACWHEDGTVDFSMGMGAAADYPDVPPPIPVELHLKWAWKARLGWERSSHQATNILIDVDGDRAVSETTSLSILQRPPKDGTVVYESFCGRWLDRWSRRDGRWAIDHRRAVTDIYAQSTSPADLPAMASTATSRRDPTDPSYEFSNFA